MVIDINGKACKVDVSNVASIEDAIGRLQNANVLLLNEIEILTETHLSRTGASVDNAYYGGRIEENKQRLKKNDDLINMLSTMKSKLEPEMQQ